MNRLREQRGQSLVLTVVFMAGLLGMASLVLDVGHWYRSQRNLQAVADAAALAGAQALPGDTGAATTAAKQYAHDNGGPVPTISFDTKYYPQDTIKVEVQRDEDGIFSKVFAIAGVTVHAHASARTAAPAAARWVAPVAVSIEHPMLQCTNAQGDKTPCEGDATLNLMNLHDPHGGDAAGSLSLLDLRKGGNGNAGENDLATWMQMGFDGYMDTGIYDASPSANFNSSQFQDALSAHMGNGDEVLFPVYQPPIVESGSHAEFTIVGWVGFVIDSETGSGNSRQLNGHFVEYIAEGIQTTSGNGNGFGVKTIELID